MIKNIVLVILAILVGILVFAPFVAIAWRSAGFDYELSLAVGILSGACIGYLFGSKLVFG